MNFIHDLLFKLWVDFHTGFLDILMITVELTKVYATLIHLFLFIQVNFANNLIDLKLLLGSSDALV